MSTSQPRFSAAIGTQQAAAHCKDQLKGSGCGVGDEREKERLNFPSSVGRDLDTVHITPDGLRFADKLVVFDNEPPANSLIDPL